MFYILKCNFYYFENLLVDYYGILSGHVDASKMISLIVLIIALFFFVFKALGIASPRRSKFILGKKGRGVVIAHRGSRSEGK